MKKSRDQLLRERLFEQYVLNLNLVNQNLISSNIADTNHAILCPVCKKPLSYEHLDVPKVLTLDHVPPKSLGGKRENSVLLCDPCNSSFGSKIDSQLGKTLHARDFASGSPHSSIDARFSSNELPPIDVTLTRSGKEDLTITIGDHGRVNPEVAKQLKSEFERMQASSTFVSNLSFRGGKYQETNVAFLRIAYLMFFRLFGYSAILNPYMDQVRQQLIHPEEQLLPPTWNFPTKWAEKLEPGISLITYPSELRAFIAIFDLIRPTGASRHGVLLPTLEEEGSSLYQRLDALEGQSFDCELQGRRIEANPAFWTDPKQIFKAHELSYRQT